VADQLKLKIRPIESRNLSNLNQSDIVGAISMRIRPPTTNLSTCPITRKWPTHHPERLQLYALPTPNGVKVSSC
jgi:hypothetical protein